MIHRYRPRVEGLFARVERWTRTETGEIHWRSISRDNVTTLYGKDGNSRVADPADPSPAASDRVFSWLICGNYDDHGNAISYEYAQEDDRQVDPGLASERNRAPTANRYCKRIRYGNRQPNRDPSTWQPIDPGQLPADTWMFEVVFDYDEGHYEPAEPDQQRAQADQHWFVRASPCAGRPWPVRPDPFSSYRSSFEVRTYRRCRRVLMFHHIPELPGGGKGYDGLVRSTEFDYADLDYAQPVTIDQELAHQGSTRFASFIRAVTQSGYVLDETQPSVMRDGVRYLTYLKKSLPPVEFTYSKVTIDDQVRVLDVGSIESPPEGLDGSFYQWADLDSEGLSGILTEQGGDGQLDLVELTGPTPGCYERTEDEGWAPFRPFRQLPSLRWDQPNLRFTDLSGDGHADILITEQDALAWHPSLAE